MISIQVKRNVRLPTKKQVLLQAAQKTLELAKSDKNDLGIVIGDDKLIQKYNSEYRNVDAPTDVLSFPSGEVDPDTARVYLGDILISLPRAQQQAIVEGHPIGDELQLLVVHGTLHLLGHDHAKSGDKKKMQAAQDKILHQLGLNLSNTL